MDKGMISKQRERLKSALYKKRVEFGPNGYEPMCAICGKPPNNGALEMHESLVTRGDVSGNLELTYDIMTGYNCVLVHKECHEHANSEEGKRACAKNILKYNNYEDIMRWLGCLCRKMRSSTARQATYLIKELHEEK
jgi:hypothetical protein